MVKLIEHPIHDAENERSEEGALFQFRKSCLLIERPLHKPAQDKIEYSMHNLVGAERNLRIAEPIRKI